MSPQDGSAPPPAPLGSSLPADVFGRQDAALEDELLAAARKVFLRHMIAPSSHGATVPGRADTTRAMEPYDNEVRPEEAAACLERLGAQVRIPAPDFAAGLRHERVWVLMHMARFGTGLSRQRATQELRATLRRISADPTAHAALLAAIADGLAEASADGGVAAVHEALLREVRAALANAEPVVPS